MTDRPTLQTTAQRGYNPRRRPRLWLVLLIVLGHLGLGALLASLLAPDFTASVVERASTGFTVIITTPPEPEVTPSPPVNPEADEGAAAEAGKDAQARAVVAPENPIPRPSPAPRAASTGTANQSGAAADGDATGASGAGDGTGSGRSGQGRGGIAVAGPSVRTGSIDAARDFPIPEGGRQVRYGTSVTVAFTVGVNGRASNCSVLRPGPDPATNQLVCPLVVERIRFNPATDGNGNAVAARYGWRQDFTATRN